MTTSTPKAGWYDDPTGSGGLRFFDGVAWTEQVEGRPVELASPGLALVPSYASQLTLEPANPPATPTFEPTPEPGFAPVQPFTAPEPEPFFLFAEGTHELDQGAARPLPGLTLDPFDASAPFAQPRALGAARPLGVPATPGYHSPGYQDPSYPSAAPDPYAPAWSPPPSIAAAAHAAGFSLDPLVDESMYESPTRAHQRTVAHTGLSPLASAITASAMRRPEPAPKPGIGQFLIGKAATIAVLAGLIGTGAFGWELYGTSVLEHFRQQQLGSQLTAPTLGTQAAGDSPVVGKPGAKPAPRAPLSTIAGDTAAEGAAVGHLQIPAIHLDEYIVMGTAPEDLSKGPGIWRAGVFPGFAGNATISGHRTTHGGPFRHLDSLKKGDRIIFDAPGQPRAVFEVRDQLVVLPTDVNVTAQTPGVRLTLTTCDPVGYASHRRIIEAEEVEGAAASQAVPRSAWRTLY